MDALHQARAHGIPPEDAAWEVQRDLLDVPRVALARARPGHLGDPRRAPPLRALQGDGLGGGRPRGARRSRISASTGRVDDWKRLREEIVDEVCSRGFDTRRGTFTQYYGSRELDAALLLMPAVGFLPATTSGSPGRWRRSSASCAATGSSSGTRRRSAAARLDGLPPGEGAFLPCSFWLADAYLLGGAPRRGARAVRAAAGAAQRRRPALRGVRPGRGAAGRELPPGAQPPRAGQHRARPRLRHRPEPSPGFAMSDCADVHGSAARSTREETHECATGTPSSVFGRSVNMCMSASGWAPRPGRAMRSGSGRRERRG